MTPEIQAAAHIVGLAIPDAEDFSIGTRIMRDHGVGGVDYELIV